MTVDASTAGRAPAEGGSPAAGGHIAVLTLVIAAAYVATGYIGQVMAIPPGNVTLLWPPSGISLGAVLLAGRRAVPGIFLGALIVNGQVIFDASTTDSLIWTGIASLLIGIGSVLQPLAAGWLIRRFSEAENPFGAAGSLVRTCLLMALACAVSSTIGSQSLGVTGLIPADQALRTMGTWWLGDLVGMVAFTPLVLAVFRLSKLTALGLILVAALAFTGVYMGAQQARDQATRVWDAQAARETERLTSTLISWIENTVAPVNSMTTLFEASTDIFDDEFLEAAIRLEDYQPDFFPSTMAVANVLNPDADAPDWEVLYSTNETGVLAVGSVLRFGGRGYQALNAALNEPGRLVIGEVFVDEDGATQAIAAMAIESVDYEQVVLGVLDIGQLFDGLFAVQVPDGVDLRFSGTPAGSPADRQIQVYGDAEPAADTVVTKSIRGTVGQALFRFDWDVSENYQKGHRSHVANAILIGGVMGAAVVLLFLTFLLNQNEQIRARVRERTQELAEKEGELRLALDNMPGGMILTDSSLNIRLLNTEFSKFLGLPDGLMQPGDPHEKLLRYMAEHGYYGDDIDIDAVVAERLESLRDPGEKVFYDHTPGGKVHEIRRRRTPEGDVVTVATDVTDREQAARVVRENEARFRGIFETGAAGMALINMDGTYEQVNGRFCEIVGYDDEELKTLTWRDITHPDDIAIVAEMDRKVEAGEQSEFQIERRFIRKDGDVVWTNLSSSQLRNEDGKPQFIYSFVLDITELKEAERAIRESEKNLRDLLDSAPVGISVVNKKTNIRVFANETLVGMMGASSPDDLATTIDASYANPEDLEEMRRLTEADGGFNNLQIKRKRLDGSVFWCLQSSQPLASFDGAPAHVTWMVDIDDRVQSERTARRLREAMEVFTDSIILYDSNERVVFTNHRYHELYPNSPPKDEITAFTQEQLLRRSLDAGQINDPLAHSDPDAWVAKRLDERRNVGESEGESAHMGDRTLLIRHKPTEDGGLIIAHTDITERKQAEAALAAQEARIRAIMESVPDAVITIDTEAVIQSANHATEEIFGYTADDLIGQTVNILMPESQAEKHDEYVANYIFSGDARFIGLGPRKLEAKRKSGEVFPVELSIAEASIGVNRLFVGVMRDITDRVAQERELETQREQLADILDNISQGLILWSEEEKLVAWNKRFLESVNLTEDDFSEDFNLTDLATIFAKRGAYGEGDLDVLIEDRVTALNAGDFHSESSYGDDRIFDVQSFRTPAGRLVMSYTDITDRKKQEEEIARQKAVLETTLETMDQGISMVDADLNLMACNARFLEMLEFPADQFGPGVSLEALFRHNAERGEYGEGDIEAQVEERLDLARQFESHQFERTRPDGTVLEVRGNPLPNKQGFVTSYSDITERKRQEEEIAAKEAQLRFAMENMPGAMAVVDENLDVVLVNETYTDYYGDADGLVKVGANMADILKSEVVRGVLSGEGSAEDILQERIQGYLNREELNFVDRTVDGRHIQMMRKPIDGGYTITIAIDITERKKIEEEIEHQRAQFFEILENTTQGMVLWAPDRKPIAWNSRFPDAVGISAEKFEDGFTQDDLAMVLAERGDYGDGDVKKLAKERVDHLWSGDSRSELSFDGKRTFDVQSSLTPGGRLVVSYADITERKEAEELINQQRTRLVDAIESLDAAFAMYDADDKLVICNKTFRRSYPPVFDLLKPGISVRELAEAYCDRTGVNEEKGLSKDDWVDRRVALHHQRRTGDLVQQDDRWFIMNDFSTSDGGVVSLRYDVTEMKETERALADKEAILSAALENMTGGLFMIDADLKLRVFNDRLAELYDIPKSLLKVGDSVESILRVRAERGEYGDGDIDELVKERVDGYQNRDIQMVIDRVSGGRIIEVYRAPMEDGGMVCVFNDVTERKKAEEELNEAHSLITESLGYASRIQRSVLPPRTILEEVFADHALVWRPKDIVGGDMVWLRPAEGGFYLIVADCTGHGPPGAFMTMICTGAIDKALVDMAEPDPAELLQRMNVAIKTALGQDGDTGESDDGVELGICFVDDKHNELTFAGARFSLHVLDGDMLDEIKGDKSAIGYRHVPMDRMFTNHSLKTSPGKRFYMWSDGLVDQIGGPKRRSFGKRRLKRIILDYSKMGLEQHKTHIIRDLEEYQHAESQRDDWTFFGFALKP